MKRPSWGLALLAFVTVAALVPARQVANPDVDGLWRAHGYGVLLQIRAGKRTVYEVTRVSCVVLPEENRTRFDLDNMRDIHLNASGDLLTLYGRNGNIYRFSRESGLPKSCLDYGPSDDRVLNFEVFWNSFEENYAFFHINDVDWHASYKVYRPQVNPDTTNDELLKLFAQMVTPLKDYHVSIRAGDKRVSYSPYKLTNKRNEVWDLVRNRYLKGEFNTRLHQLRYGTLDAKTGYLRIGQMAGFTAQRISSEETMGLLEAAMDEILESFQELDKIVLDVRFNGGGSDPFARYFAERFTDRRRLAYSKQARNGGYGEFTPLVEFYIEPKGKRQSTQQVVVLINGASGSATEIFMECMQALPQVSIVGENTAGAFSDNLGKLLPNGWRLSMSNEAYYNHKGVCLEGSGVPPHIRVPLTLKDLEEGRDLALEKAMSL